MIMKNYLMRFLSIFFVPKHLHSVFALSLLFFFLRLIYVSIGPIDLSPDEAHYWEWSRYLDWSYYSKPPFTAWLSAISTSVFGHTHLGVRFFSCLAISILGFLAFVMARQVGSQKSAWFAFILIHITALFAAGGLMMTPDIPSLTFWALALYLLMNMNFDAKEISIKPFIFLGVVVGLAGLSKYTVAVFYPLLGVYLLMDKQRRLWLLKPHIYLAGLVSLAMQWPVLYWNFIHDFVGFKHVLWQNSVSTRHFGLKSFTNFLEGQAGVLSPVIFLLLLCAWVSVGYEIVKQRLKKTGTVFYKLELLWIFSFPIFFAFLLKSTTGKVQPNWPVLSIFSGFVLLAVWVSYKNKFWKGSFYVGLALSLILTILAHDTFLVRKGLKLVGVEKEIPFRKDPLKPVMGWRGLGQAVSALAESRLGDDYYVLTTRYQTASSLSFYMKDNPKVLYANLGHRRQNQYDYWPWPDDLALKPVVYVRENGPIEAKVLNAFTACAELGQVASRRDTVLMRTAYVYGCFGYKGLERIMAERY
jgi:4-amino-4-deoxy-L-arabinose transferase-like glycosyltransferase